MHVQARTPVMLHSVIVHSRTSLLGPVAHACHAHERSSRFFVMLVHRTYTSIREAHRHQSLLHPAQHVPCLLSPVSIVLQFLFSKLLSALSSSRLLSPETAHNILLSSSQHPIYCHAGILAFSCCLSSLRFPFGHRRFPARSHMVVTILGMLWGERFIANPDYDHWPQRRPSLQDI